MHMLSKKDLSSDEMETLRRSRKPTTVVTANGEMQTSEEAQVRVHDLDLFVTVQILDDTLLWVGQRSKVTIDQRWEEYYLQGGQLRTSCRSKVIHQLWKRFVFYIAITGLVEKRGRNSIQETGATCFKFIFRFSNTAKWRNSIQETGAITRNSKSKQKEWWQEKFGRSAGRSSWVVGGFQRKSERHRIDCIRTQFSRIRSGISYDSGNEIEEALYL